jgi:hypothetical protein
MNYFNNISYKEHILFFAAALILTYFIYKGIQKPIDFEKAKDARYEATIEKRKLIKPKKQGLEEFIEE